MQETLWQLPLPPLPDTAAAAAAQWAKHDATWYQGGHWSARPSQRRAAAVDGCLYVTSDATLPAPPPEHETHMARYDAGLGAWVRVAAPPPSDERHATTRSGSLRAFLVGLSCFDSYELWAGTLLTNESLSPLEHFSIWDGFELGPGVTSGNDRTQRQIIRVFQRRKHGSLIAETADLLSSFSHPTTDPCDHRTHGPCNMLCVVSV